MKHLQVQLPVGKLLALKVIMKIAIPEFNGRVSPTLDFCRHLLLVDICGDELSEMITLDFSEMESSRRVLFLKKLGVDTLLCGGISRSLAEDIRGSGIKVVPWVSGEIWEVISAYLMDKLPDPKLTSPGFHPEEDQDRLGREDGSEWNFTEGGEKRCFEDMSGDPVPEHFVKHSTEDPAGFCVCPRCGHRIAGEKDIPCSKIPCPDCGSIMFRE
jgi:predicted Fe-Mo cluster-binding NifX family protein